MLEKTFGLLFFLKQPKNKEEDNRFIYVKITVDGKAVELSTKRRCEQLRWNAHAGRATGTKEASKELNQFLDSFEQYVFHVKKLDIVRDVFVFSCYTGLAYADVRNLRRSDIKKGVDIFRYNFDRHSVRFEGRN